MPGHHFCCAGWPCCQPGKRSQHNARCRCCPTSRLASSHPGDEPCRASIASAPGGTDEARHGRSRCPTPVLRTMDPSTCSFWTLPEAEPPSLSCQFCIYIEFGRFSSTIRPIDRSAWQGLGLGSCALLRMTTWRPPSWRGSPLSVAIRMNISSRSRTTPSNTPGYG